MTTKQLEQLGEEIRRFIRDNNDGERLVCEHMGLLPDTTHPNYLPPPSERRRRWSYGDDVADATEDDTEVDGAIEAVYKGDNWEARTEVLKDITLGSDPDSVRPKIREIAEAMLNPEHFGVDGYYGSLHTISSPEPTRYQTVKGSGGRLIVKDTVIDLSEDERSLLQKSFEARSLALQKEALESFVTPEAPKP